VRRGDIWIASRLGHERKVVIVGHDGLTAKRDRVLVVPLSDVRAATLIEPVVHATDGEPAGVATTPGVGEIAKSSLTTHVGALAPASVESLDVALRAALDL
jgi:mRNA-degrading endonuclease toxin of MazEF toxin-antitoxin module